MICTYPSHTPSREHATAFLFVPVRAGAGAPFRYRRVVATDQAARWPAKLLSNQTVFLQPVDYLVRVETENKTGLCFAQ